jgi:O-antigen/teichoic acid export membrane protein
MKQKSLKVNSALNVFKTVLSLLFPLITVPYITRVLQVETVGVYNFSASIVSYFILIAGLGIDTYAIREGPKYRNNKKDIDKFVSEVFSINLFSTIFAYGLLLLSVFAVQKLHGYEIAIAILSVDILFTTFGASWICNIFEDFLFLAIQSIGVQVISLILVLTLVKSPEDLYIYIAIVAFSHSLSNIINFIYIQKKYCHFKFTFRCNLKEHLKPILIIFSTSVAITVYVSSDVTMLGFMTSDYQVGLYGTAVKIYTIVKNIIFASVIVLIPRFSFLLQLDRDEEAKRLFSYVFDVIIVLALPATIGLFITSEDVIHLVGGSNYIEGASALRFLCIALSFSLTAALYTHCLLIPMKKESFVLISTAISAVMNIGLNFIMIPLLGINGAAITTIIAEMIVCVSSVLYSRKFIHLNSLTRDVISTIVGCIAIIAIGIVCACILKDNYLLRLFVTIVLSVLGYSIILLVFKNSVAMNFLRSVLKKLTH